MVRPYRSGASPWVRDGGTFVGVRPGSRGPATERERSRWIAVAAHPDGARLADLLARTASRRSCRARVACSCPVGTGSADVHRAMAKGGVRGSVRAQALTAGPCEMAKPLLVNPCVYSRRTLAIAAGGLDDGGACRVDQDF